MKRKNNKIRGVITAQKNKAWKGLREARDHHRRAVETEREVKAYLRKQKKRSRDDRALLRDAEQLVRDTRDREIYMEGVVMGMAILDRAISQRLIAEEMDPFGWPR